MNYVRKRVASGYLLPTLGLAAMALTACGPGSQSPPDRYDQSKMI